MFCDRCGTQLATDARFCTSCGKPLGPTPAPAAQAKRSIASHVRLLGILWVAYGALHALPGLLVMAIFGNRFLPPDVPPFVYNFLPFVGGLLAIGGGLAALTGAGLMLRHAWARPAALVMAFLNVLNVPLGTALGIYTLWALLPAEHEEQYRALTETA